MCLMVRHLYYSAGRYCWILFAARLQKTVSTQHMVTIALQGGSQNPSVLTRVMSVIFYCQLAAVDPEITCCALFSWKIVMTSSLYKYCVYLYVSSPWLITGNTDIQYSYVGLGNSVTVLQGAMIRMNLFVPCYALYFGTLSYMTFVSLPSVLFLDLHVLDERVSFYQSRALADST